MLCSRPWGARLALLALLPLLSSSGSACGDNGASELAWRVRFACEGDRAASDRVRLRLRAGGCGGAIMYEDLTARGGALTASGSVGPGTYGFEAAALRGDQVVVERCVEAQLPRTDALELELPSARCALTPEAAPPAQVYSADAAPSDADAHSARDAAARERAMGDDVAATSALDGGRIEAGSPPAPAVDRTMDAARASAPSDATPADAGTRCTSCADAGPCVTCDAGACVNADCAAPSSCEALHKDGHTYLICAEPSTWRGARDHCRSWGGGLAIIGGADENRFLLDHLAGADRWIGANARGSEPSFGCFPAGGNTWYWASATSASERETPLCTAWGNGACAALAGAYQNWRSGQPDNWQCACAFSGCRGGEDCATILAQDGRWNDSGCDLQLGYICESP